MFVLNVWYPLRLPNEKNLITMTYIELYYNLIQVTHSYLQMLQWLKCVILFFWTFQHEIKQKNVSVLSHTIVTNKEQDTILDTFFLHNLDECVEAKKCYMMLLQIPKVINVIALYAWLHTCTYMRIISLLFMPFDIFTFITILNLCYSILSYQIIFSCLCTFDNFHIKYIIWNDVAMI